MRCYFAAVFVVFIINCLTEIRNVFKFWRQQYNFWSDVHFGFFLGGLIASVTTKPVDNDVQLVTPKQEKEAWTDVELVVLSDWY